MGDKECKTFPRVCRASAIEHLQLLFLQISKFLQNVLSSWKLSSITKYVPFAYFDVDLLITLLANSWLFYRILSSTAIYSFSVVPSVRILKS